MLQRPSLPSSSSTRSHLPQDPPTADISFLPTTHQIGGCEPWVRRKPECVFPSQPLAKAGPPPPHEPCRGVASTPHPHGSRLSQRGLGASLPGSPYVGDCDNASAK